jgi:chaperone modulatory protein CbpM
MEGELMATTTHTLLHCQVVEEDVEMSLGELCRACDAERSMIEQLVEHGVLEPRGSPAQGWVFVGASLRRTRVALRLMRDLDVNLPGAALAVELLDQIERLRHGG